jgi:hypothetical protein
MMSLGRSAFARQASKCFVGSTPRSAVRSLSSNNYDEPIFENFQASPPAQLTTAMAEGIGDATQFYVRHGISNQRLRAMSKDDSMPIVVKWQKMMEVFLTTQVHVIAGLGYSADEQGLTQYAQDLANCINNTDDTMRALFTEVRRDTWRELVATCFDLKVDEIKTLDIVEARSLMHKVSSRMIEPEVLQRIQKSCATIENNDPEHEIAMKHQVLQDVIVNHVYLGGTPSLTEDSGFGAGAKGYANLQCAMSDHEGDPLIAEYATSAMMKIWSAAGLDLSSVTGPGLNK